MKAKPIRLSLAPALYAELAEMAAKFDEPGFSPARCAEEILVSELASRRLSRIETPRGYGGRHRGAAIEPYHVHIALPNTETL